MLRIDCLTGSEENLSTLEEFGNLVNFSRINLVIFYLFIFDSLTALGARVNKDYCNVYVKAAEPSACWSVLITLQVRLRFSC